MAVKKSICNICGGAKFKLGPGGRTSSTNLPPVCEGCGSLERHRVMRAIFDKIRTVEFKKFNALIFTKDQSVAGGWFGSARYSVAGTKDAVDIQATGLAKGSVDVLICNHVLTAVPDYRAALKEITRVISDKGFAFMSFPNPHFRSHTEDWGKPDPARHNHYRVFGADIEQEMPALMPSTGILRVAESDPVTGVEDRAYIVSKNMDLLDSFAEAGWRIRFLHF